MGTEGVPKPKNPLDEALANFSAARKERETFSTHFEAGTDWSGQYNFETSEVTLMYGTVTSRAILQGNEIQYLETYGPDGNSLEDDTHSKQMHTDHLQRLIDSNQLPHQQNDAMAAE